jgi:hypothetical protein
MRSVKKGATDQTFYFKMIDSAAGTPETGLTITNLDITYVRNRAAHSKTDATALSAVTDAHSDNKAIEVDATQAPGLYRVDFPDAAFATGVDDVILIVTCSGCDPAMIEVMLVDNIEKDTYDRIGAPAGASIAADLVTIDDFLDTEIAAIVTATGAAAIRSAVGLASANLDTQLAAIDDLVDTEVAAIKTVVDAIEVDTQDIQGRLPAALVSGRIDASVGAMAANVLTASAIAADAITDAKVASDVTIASVTGAVGSVTGNVGGNVTGSVGSIATGGIAAASFAAGAIDAAAIATNAIGSDELAASAITEIQSGLATSAALTTVEGKIDTIDGIVDSILVDTAEIGAAGAGLTVLATQASVNTIDDFLDTEIAAIKAKTDNLPSDPADASVVAGLIAAAEAKIDIIDTTADAIKAKTDSLTFAVAGQVDANIQYVNNTQVTGAGTTGDPWGP